jgi:hypothetical protein
MSDAACPQGGERDDRGQLRLDHRRRLLRRRGSANDGTERTKEPLMLYELAQIIVLSKDLHRYPSAAARAG